VRPSGCVSFGEPMTALPSLRTTVPLPPMPRLVRPSIAWTLSLLLSLGTAATAALAVSSLRWLFGLLGLAAPLALTAWLHARARRPRAVTVADGFADFDSQAGHRRVALASIVGVERDRGGLVLVTAGGAESIPLDDSTSASVVQEVTAALGHTVRKDWRVERPLEDPGPDSDRRARIQPWVALASSFILWSSIYDGAWPLMFVAAASMLIVETQLSRGLALASTWLSIGLGCVTAVVLARVGFDAAPMRLATHAAVGAALASLPWTTWRSLEPRSAGSPKWGYAPYPQPRPRWVVGVEAAVFLVIAWRWCAEDPTLLISLGVGALGLGIAGWARRGEPELGAP
jgi:hypothetical protein